MTDATAHDWETWLRPIAASVRNTPTPADVKGRAAALAFVMRGIPPSALTPDKARDLCRKAEFFPSVAEVEAVFAADWREQARSRAIGGGPVPLGLAAPQAPPPVPMDQRAASVQAAAIVAAELRAGSAATRPAPTAAPLSPARLLAQYEALAAQGNAAASTRAAALRRAMA
jgi:hypothetical protein